MSRVREGSPALIRSFKCKCFHLLLESPGVPSYLMHIPYAILPRGIVGRAIVRWQRIVTDEGDEGHSSASANDSSSDLRHSKEEALCHDLHNLSLHDRKMVPPKMGSPTSSGRQSISCQSRSLDQDPKLAKKGRAQNVLDTLDQGHLEIKGIRLVEESSEDDIGSPVTERSKTKTSSSEPLSFPLEENRQETSKQLGKEHDLEGRQDLLMFLSNYLFEAFGSLVRGNVYPFTVLSRQGCLIRDLDKVTVEYAQRTTHDFAHRRGLTRLKPWFDAHLYLALAPHRSIQQWLSVPSLGTFIRIYQYPAKFIPPHQYHHVLEALLLDARFMTQFCRPNLGWRELPPLLLRRVLRWRCGYKTAPNLHVALGTLEHALTETCTLTLASIFETALSNDYNLPYPSLWVQSLWRRLMRLKQAAVRGDPFSTFIMAFARAQPSLFHENNLMESLVNRDDHFLRGVARYSALLPPLITARVNSSPYWEGYLRGMPFQKGLELVRTLEYFLRISKLDDHRLPPGSNLVRYAHIVARGLSGQGSMGRHYLITLAEANLWRVLSFVLILEQGDHNTRKTNLAKISDGLQSLTDPRVFAILHCHLGVKASDLVNLRASKDQLAIYDAIEKLYRSRLACAKIDKYTSTIWLLVPKQYLQMEPLKLMLILRTIMCFSLSIPYAATEGQARDEALAPHPIHRANQMASILTDLYNKWMGFHSPKHTFCTIRIAFAFMRDFESVPDSSTLNPHQHEKSVTSS